MKRIVEHPYGKKMRGGGHVFLVEHLVKSVKKGDALEVGKITVGTRNLVRLLNVMPTDDVLVRANGGLEIRTVIRHWDKAKDGKSSVCHFRKPKLENAIHIVDRAWLDGKIPDTVVALKPKEY